MSLFNVYYSLSSVQQIKLTQRLLESQPHLDVFECRRVTSMTWQCSRNCKDVGVTSCYKENQHKFMRVVSWSQVYSKAPCCFSWRKKPGEASDNCAPKDYYTQQKYHAGCHWHPSPFVVFLTGLEHDLGFSPEKLAPDIGMWAMKCLALGRKLSRKPAPKGKKERKRKKEREEEGKKGREGGMEGGERESVDQVLRKGD